MSLQPSPVPAVPLLELCDVSVTFATRRGPVHAVRDVSFALNRGESLGLVGESGSGKSVLVRTIMNLFDGRPDVTVRGEILIDGSSVRHLGAKEQRRYWGTELAMVFQDAGRALNPVKRVGRHLTEAMRYQLHLGAKEARDRAIDLLTNVGISDPPRRLEQYPHELSGGMRQRLMIAMALSCEPRLLLADEPTTALDVTVQRAILDLLARVLDDNGMSSILVSHDLAVVAGRTNRTAVMYAGRIVDIGESEALFRDLRHPYTEALMNCVPRIDGETHSVLRTVPGQPVDPSTVIPGCSFAPRCLYAQPDCLAALPALVGTDRHSAACFHPRGVG